VWAPDTRHLVTRPPPHRSDAGVRPAPPPGEAGVGRPVTRGVPATPGPHARASATPGRVAPHRPSQPGAPPRGQAVSPAPPERDHLPYRLAVPCDRNTPAARERSVPRPPPAEMPRRQSSPCARSRDRGPTSPSPWRLRSVYTGVPPARAASERDG